MSRQTPKVIAFVSGKGGSGKTTATIAIAKFLSNMGERTLVIDFDLSTSGASYFFKPRFAYDTKGIWECVGDPDISRSVNSLPLTVEQGLYFTASRTKFTVKSQSYDSIQWSKNFLQDRILKPLINYAYERGCRYVLIDCQAGYSVTSEAASELANMAIVVTEADAISSDAADNLLIQMGQALPAERRFLVNKIDIRDAETYRTMKDAFQALNRLPPLPFDRGVRMAFGARQMPIDLTSPSPLLFALTETMAQAFPELYSEIQEYKQEHVDKLFEKYSDKLDELSAQKQELVHQQAQLKLRDVRFRADLVTQVGFFTMLAIVGVVGYFLLRYLLPVDSDLRITFSAALLTVVGGALAIMVVLVTRALRSRLQGELENDQTELQLAKALDDVDRELELYRSLVLARSKEYLLDFEVTQEKDFPLRK